MLKIFLLLLSFIASNTVNTALADGRIDISDGIDISFLPVIIDQPFTISFELKEHQGQSKQFDSIEIWIQDKSGDDLYKLDVLDRGISLQANGSVELFFSTTLLSEFGRNAGTYRVQVRGVIGDDVFVLNGIESGDNNVSFEAIFPTGRVDVLDHYITTFPIQQDQPFFVEFTLYEHMGYKKTLDDLELWIQDSNGNDLFKAEDWGAEFFDAYETKHYSLSLDIDSSRPNREPGAYQSVIRATVGNSIFNFDPNDPKAISFSDQSFIPNNPLSFNVTAAPVVEGFVNLTSPNLVFDSDQPRAGTEFDFSFTLKEERNAEKSFEYVQVWLSDQNDLNNRLYLIKDFGQQTFEANQEIRYQETVDIPVDPTIPTETNYDIRVWGKIANESEPFLFSYDGQFNPYFYLKAANCIFRRT